MSDARFRINQKLYKLDHVAFVLVLLSLQVLFDRLFKFAFFFVCVFFFFEWRARTHQIDLR